MPNTRQRYVYTFLNSPVGRLTLVATDAGLAAILLGDTIGPVGFGFHSTQRSHRTRCWSRPRGSSPSTSAGERHVFTMPLDMTGTPFQRKVWQALLTIPFGETRTYAQIAQQIGSPDCGAGGRRGQRPQPGVDRRPVPSRDRVGRAAHRVRGRARGQGLPAGPRTTRDGAVAAAEGSRRSRGGCQPIVLAYTSRARRARPRRKTRIRNRRRRLGPCVQQGLPDAVLCMIRHAKLAARCSLLSLRPPPSSPPPRRPRHAPAAAAAPCTTATPACTEWVTLGGGPGRSMIYRTYSLDVPQRPHHAAR